MPELHYPDTLVESYREEAGSLALTVARLRQENARLRAENFDLCQKLRDSDNRVQRLRSGGRA